MVHLFDYWDVFLELVPELNTDEFNTGGKR